MADIQIIGFAEATNSEPSTRMESHKTASILSSSPLLTVPSDCLEDEIDCQYVEKPLPKRDDSTNSTRKVFKQLSDQLSQEINSFTEGHQNPSASYSTEGGREKVGILQETQSEGEFKLKSEGEAAAASSKVSRARRGNRCASEKVLVKSNDENERFSSSTACRRKSENSPILLVNLKSQQIAKQEGNVKSAPSSTCEMLSPFRERSLNVRKGIILTTKAVSVSESAAASVALTPAILTCAATTQQKQEVGQQQEEEKEPIEKEEVDQVNQMLTPNNQESSEISLTQDQQQLAEKDSLLNEELQTQVELQTQFFNVVPPSDSEKIEEQLPQPQLVNQEVEIAMESQIITIKSHHVLDSNDSYKCSEINRDIQQSNTIHHSKSDKSSSLDNQYENNNNNNNNQAFYQVFSQLMQDIEYVTTQIREQLNEEGVNEEWYSSQSTASNEQIRLPTEEELLAELEANEKSSQSEDKNQRFLEDYLHLIHETDTYLSQLKLCAFKEKQTLCSISDSLNHRIQVAATADTTAAAAQKKQSKQYEYTSRQQQQQQNQNYHNQYHSSIETRREATHSVVAVVPQKKKIVYTHVNEMVDVSTQLISFGVVFPGNIFEELVEVTNKTDEILQVKMVGLSLDAEFDSHNEYVYSIRKTINYDYNEKLSFSVPSRQSVKLHVALKVPNVNGKRTLKGSLAIAVHGEDSYLSIPVTSSVEIPRIICPRSLFSDASTNIIRLAIRKGKKAECKVPFKNPYAYALALEPYWLTEQTSEKPFTNLPEGAPCPFNLVLATTNFTAPAKSLFMLNFQIRPNIHFKEYNDNRILSDDKSPLQIRNVLILKVSNSSVLMHFPVSLEVQ